MNENKEGKTPSATINCCTDTENKSDIWLINETHAFPLGRIGKPYQKEYSSRFMDDIKIGIVCCRNIATALVTYNIGVSSSKKEMITVSIANVSQYNASGDCSHSYTIIITGQPIERSNSKSTSIHQTALSTIEYELDSVTGPWQSPMNSKMQPSSSASRSAPIPSSSESKLETPFIPFMNIKKLISLLVLSFFPIMFGAGTCLWMFQKYRPPKLSFLSSPDHIGRTRSPDLPDALGNESKAETLQMVPLSSTSRPNTTEGVPSVLVRRLNGEINLVLNKLDHPQERPNPLGPEENHYQNIGNETISEAEYGAYSSIHNVYYSFGDMRPIV